MTERLRVIGIDPGSRFTGYGIVETQGSQQQCIAHGRIVVKGQSMAERLLHIYEGLSEVIRIHLPEEFAIEQIFYHKNARAALTLGQARGAALVAAAAACLPVTEYSAKQIKQAAVGFGAANKEQMQYMMRHLLNLKETPETDAADALAIAICHCQTQRFARKISASVKETEKL